MKQKKINARAKVGCGAESNRPSFSLTKPSPILVLSGPPPYLCPSSA